MAFNPLREKYHPFYWEIVADCAKQSVAKRHQVGAALVLPSGLISAGWNGTVAGADNECEEWIPSSEDSARQQLKTKPGVLHAEWNAINKLLVQGISPTGGILFVSRAPCIRCATLIQPLGIAHVFYDEDHDDMTGVELLTKCEVPVTKRVV